MMIGQTRLSAALLAGSLLAAPAVADEIGSFTNDWVGNGIVVEAIADPKVEGVTCHVFISSAASSTG